MWLPSAFYNAFLCISSFRVWFFFLSFLTLSRPYNLARVCLNCKVKQGIACTTELLCLMNFFVLQVYRSNEYNNNFLNCNCQQMTLKQDSVHFVVCPKQGNEIEGIVSKNCLSWRCFILNSRWGFQTLSDSPLAIHPGLTVPNLKWITLQPMYTKTESRNSFG